MQRKSLITLVLAGALLGVCGLAALAMYSTYGAFRASNTRIRWFEDALTSAVVTETLRFEISPGAKLAIEACAGDITVTRGDAGVIEGEQTAIAWGANEAEAMAAAQAVSVRVQASPASVRITCDHTNQVVVIGGGEGHDTVGFTLRVPDDTALALDSHGGAIDVKGIAGDADVRSAWGDVVLADLGGTVHAESNAGAVRATGIDAADGDVTLSSSHGEVTANDVAGRTVDISSDSGKVWVKGLVVAGDATVRSSFGEIDVNSSIAESLTIEASSGKVDIAEVHINGLLKVEADFGDIDVDRALAAEFEFTSQNGAVTLDRPSGSITAQSNFGDITITNGIGVRLDLGSGNGAIAFSGSLDPTGDHSIETDFGKIVLTLPGDSRFNVRLKTDFGKVTSELPITITGAVVESERTGTLNGGGRQLEVTTANGDIDLRLLAPGALDHAAPVFGMSAAATATVSPTTAITSTASITSTAPITSTVPATSSTP